MSNPYNNTLEQGLKGSHVLNSDEGTVTTAFGGLLAVEDTVLASLTAPNMTNSADLVGVTLPAGIYIPERIDSISITSGTVLAYERYS